MITICLKRIECHYRPALVSLIVVSLMISVAGNVEAKQKTFVSPEQAVTALIEAIRQNDQKALIAILGPAAKELVHSGDPVQDERKWGEFVKAFDEMNKLEMERPDRTILHVGKHEWPLPIPIVKQGGKWFFDAAAGREEILNRRIGRNELNVIEVVRAYADAQREYARKDQDGDLSFIENKVQTLFIAPMRIAGPILIRPTPCPRPLHFNSQRNPSPRIEIMGAQLPPVTEGLHILGFFYLKIYLKIFLDISTC